MGPVFVQRLYIWLRMLKGNDSLRKRFEKQMRTFCADSCQKHNKLGKWSRKDIRHLKKCIQADGCSKFADCVTQYMY